MRDWRWKGKGPKFIKTEGGINYRVGAVLEWIHSREVKSTTQADTLNDDNIDYASWSPEKLIDENSLAQWLNESVKTIRDWRITGKGPQFIKKPKRVNYRVGTVLEWIKAREVKSTTQADTLK